MRLRVTLSVLALGALTAAAAIGTPVARLHAQSQGAIVGPVSYDFTVRFEGTSWDGSLIIFPDSSIVIPGSGSCKMLDRTRRRVSANQESWPCDGPSNLQDFQIIVDRQNYRATSWKATAQRPFEKPTTICAMTRSDASGKEICVRYETTTDFKATPVSGRIDLIPRTPARP